MSIVLSNDETILAGICAALGVAYCIACNADELQSDDETNKSLTQSLRAQDPVTRMMDGDEILDAQEAQ